MDSDIKVIPLSEYVCPYGWVECAYWKPGDMCSGPILDSDVFVDCCPCFTPEDIPDEFIKLWL